MCLSADNSTKIAINYIDSSSEESTSTKKEKSEWIVTAQSATQVDLLKNHKKELPIYVEGPNYTWIRSQMVEYFVMKTDPLEETLAKLKAIENANLDDLTDMHNVFDDPFRKTLAMTKRTPSVSVHEMTEGTFYAICCTQSSTKKSLYEWTKLLEARINCLKDFVIVYKLKEKSTDLVDPSKLKKTN